MIPLSVSKIERGYPERDGGAEEEEGQGWGDSRRLITKDSLHQPQSKPAFIEKSISDISRNTDI